MAEPGSSRRKPLRQGLKNTLAHADIPCCMVPMVFLITAVQAQLEGRFSSRWRWPSAHAGMLPMIVSVCLSKAPLQCRRKRSSSKAEFIQNFGRWSALHRQDRTLTIDHVILELHCDVFKMKAKRSCATPISSAIPNGLRMFSTGGAETRACTKSRRRAIQNGGRNPFDFSRRMMSWCPDPNGQRQLLTKGAESVFKNARTLRVKARFSDGAHPRRQPHRTGEFVERDGFECWRLPIRDGCKPYPRRTEDSY